MGSVEGIVVDAAGKPVPGTAVVLGERQLATDATGKFILHSVCPGRYLATFAPPQESNLEAGTLFDVNAPGLLVDVRPGQVAHIRQVLQAAGQIELALSWNGAALSLAAMEALAPSGADFTLAAGGSRYAGPPIETRGKLVFWGLPPGTDYELTAGLNGFMKQVKRGIEVKRGEATTVHFDFAPDVSTGVAGTVRDSNGKPLADRYVEVVHRENPDWSGETYTGADGRFRIVGLEPGDYSLVTYGHRHGFVTVARGSITDVDIDVED